MRILALTNLFPPYYLGGYEVICQTVVGELRRRGHQVRVLTSNHGLTGKFHTEHGPNPLRSRRGNEADGSHLVGNPPPHVGGYESRETSGIEQGTHDEPEVERSLRIHGLYGHPWLGIWKLRKLERENNALLRESLQRFRPDLVYVWNMGGLSKSMLLTLQRLDFPVVYYLSDHWIARGLAQDVWLRWWNDSRAKFHQKILRSIAIASGWRRRMDEDAPTDPGGTIHFERIYFCSEALKRLTLNAGYDVRHAAVIHCPIDLARFAGEPRGERFERLLYAGRLNEDKGVPTLLEAMARLNGNVPVKLTLCGNGDPPFVARLREFVERHRLEVEFASAEVAEMPAIYRSHDALVFPSEWEEPFALTPIEAMSCGLPVIGTLRGGSSELFRDGENALTFRAGDAVHLAETLMKAASNRELRMRCAHAGWCEVRQRCGVEAIVDQIEPYLHETVAEWKRFPSEPT